VEAPLAPRHLEALAELQAQQYGLVHRCRDAHASPVVPRHSSLPRPGVAALRAAVRPGLPRVLGTRQGEARGVRGDRRPVVQGHLLRAHHSIWTPTHLPSDARAMSMWALPAHGALRACLRAERTLNEPVGLSDSLGRTHCGTRDAPQRLNLVRRLLRGEVLLPARRGSFPPRGRTVSSRLSCKGISRNSASRTAGRHHGLDTRDDRA
jgi:hypothetical protein